MSKRPRDVDVRLGSATQPAARPLDPDAPFRLLVLGDFGGGGGPLAARNIRAWRETRRRLEDPRTFEEAAREVRAVAGPTPARREEAAPAAAADDVVGDLLAGAARRAKAEDRAFEAELKEIVRPHLAPAEDADLPRLKDAVDEARAALLRSLLEAPRFRSLEAAWRSLDLIVRRAPDEHVRVFFLDASREALLEDLRSAENLSGTGLWRRLVTDTVETPGAEPWGALLGLYEFGPTLADAALLARLAKTAQAAGAPFLAGARPGLVGCDSLAATPDPADWRTPEGEGALVFEELRALPEAAWTALALPRVMLRLPYGSKTDPIDSFPFEEIAGAPENEDYLWGSGALACAAVLVAAFEEGGWDLVPERAAEIRDLPAHVYKDGPETRVTPPSEVVLTVRAAERMLEAGLVPVLSLKGQDVVRVARLQSIARPLRTLAGGWSR